MASEKRKFTTTLSEECLKGIIRVRKNIDAKYDNEVIEYLVQKEVERYEMDSKK